MKSISDANASRLKFEIPALLLFLAGIRSYDIIGMTCPLGAKSSSRVALSASMLLGVTYLLNLIPATSHTSAMVVLTLEAEKF